MHNGKIKFLVIPVCLFLFLGCSKGIEIDEKKKKTPDPVSEANYKKELEEIRKGLKSDIRIKLKKDGKGSYAWEITGKDPQEIIRANNVLRGRISDEKRE